MLHWINHFKKNGVQMIEVAAPTLDDLVEKVEQWGEERLITVNSTPQAQLLEPERPKKIGGLSAEQMARMEQEMSLVQSRFRAIESSYNTDVLSLVVARGYVAKLMSNKAVASYLRRKTILNGIDFFCHPPIDGRELGYAADLQRALGPGSMRNPGEWRPGQEKQSASAPSAFELVEDFAADLHARFVVLASNDSDRTRESWKSNFTHQLFA